MLFLEVMVMISRGCADADVFTCLVCVCVCVCVFVSEAVKGRRADWQQRDSDGA